MKDHMLVIAITEILFGVVLGAVATWAALQYTHRSDHKAVD